MVSAPAKIISKDDYLLYKTQGLNHAEIANKLGVSDVTLYKRLKAWGIETEKRSKAADKKQSPPKHPPAFYTYLEEQGLQDKADELRRQAGITVEETDAPAPTETPKHEADQHEGPHTPSQQELQEMFEPTPDSLMTLEGALPVKTPYVVLKLPLIKGDHVGSYGMQIHHRYEQFGQHLDFAHLDRGALFSELLQMAQAVLAWLQSDIGQLVVDEAEQMSTLMNFINHYNQVHVDMVLEKAAAGGWEVLEG